MRVVDVDKFIEDFQEISDDSLEIINRDYTNSDTLKNVYYFFEGVDYILNYLIHSPEILEITEIAKDVIYPRGCDEVDIDCNDCEHHRSTQWCARAIENVKEANPVYEEGWMDGVDAAAKSLDGYTSGYADGWDDGWKECLESIRIAMKKVLEDNK